MDFPGGHIQMTFKLVSLIQYTVSSDTQIVSKLEEIIDLLVSYLHNLSDRISNTEFNVKKGGMGRAGERGALLESKWKD